MAPASWPAERPGASPRRPARRPVQASSRGGAACRDPLRRWNRAACVELRQTALERYDIALQGGEGCRAVADVGVEAVEPLAGGGDGFARGQGDAGQRVEIRDAGREARRRFRERAALGGGLNSQFIRRLDPLQRAGERCQPLAQRAGIAQGAAAFALALLAREVEALGGELAIRGGQLGVALRRFVEQRFEPGAVRVAGLPGERRRRHRAVRAGSPAPRDRR